MTFGRPFMVGDSYTTRFPSMIDEEYLQETGVGRQPPQAPSRMGLFVGSCNLFEILRDILTAFYLGNGLSKRDNDGTIQEIIEDVLNFNRRLDAFSSSLPDYLKAPNSSRPPAAERDNYINLQQQVLYCRLSHSYSQYA